MRSFKLTILRVCLIVIMTSLPKISYSQYWGAPTPWSNGLYMMQQQTMQQAQQQYNMLQQQAQQQFQQQMQMQQNIQNQWNQPMDWNNAPVYVPSSAPVVTPSPSQTPSTSVNSSQPTNNPRACVYCNGTGKIERNDNPPASFGTRTTSNRQCSECGKTYDPGTVNHYHIRCSHCGGTGIQR